MFKLSRLFIIYALAVPLALYLGYLASTPENRFTYIFVGGVLFILALPLFLKWHHVLLIVFWNSVFNASFLPGGPDFWLLIGILSFSIAFLNHIMFQKPFLRAPELTTPLLFFAAIVFVTAEIRGGIGIRAFGGSSFGGRYYFYIFGAIAGYFAFTSESVPIQKAKKFGELYFLAGTSAVLSNVFYVLGPAFYIFYIIVPTGAAVMQASADQNAAQISRIGGLSSACISFMCFLLARYGVRGLFDWNRPWRFLLLVATFSAAFFGGFRSMVVILFLIFSIQFYLEGLLRTHYFPIVLGLAIAGLAPILFFSSSMPAPVQRAISFLPVNVDSEVLNDARASSEWRFQMWAEAAKDIPKYLLVGKGFSINPEDLYAVTLQSQLGISTEQFEGSLIAGDYHSGPLSVLIPFGILGAVGFLWILYGGYKILSLNLRYGDLRLRRINIVLLSFYITYCISFFFIFGALQTELSVFLGVCGMSVTLNGGVRRKVKARPAPEPAPPATMVMEAG